MIGIDLGPSSYTSGVRLLGSSQWWPESLSGTMTSVTSTMSLSAIALVLTSAIIHVCWNLLTKSSTTPRVFSLLTGTVILGIASSFLLAAPLTTIPRTVWLFLREECGVSRLAASAAMVGGLYLVATG